MHQLTLFEGKKKSLSSSLKTRTVKNLFFPPCLNVSIQKKKKKKGILNLIFFTGFYLCYITVPSALLSSHLNLIPPQEMGEFL